MIRNSEGSGCDNDSGRTMSASPIFRSPKNVVLCLEIRKTRPSFLLFSAGNSWCTSSLGFLFEKLFICSPRSHPWLGVHLLYSPSDHLFQAIANFPELIEKNAVGN